MPSSTTPFEWGQVVTPLRWIVRGLGVVCAAFGLFLVGVGALGSGPTAVLGYVLAGIIGAGLLLAIFWTGIGEVVGGLAVFGAAVGLAVWRGVVLLFGPVTVVGLLFIFLLVPVALIGLLFSACGWYTLVQRSQRATHATA